MGSSIIFLIIGLIVGVNLGIISSRIKILKKYIPRNDYDQIMKEYNDLKIEAARLMNPEAVSKAFVAREAYQALEEELRSCKSEDQQKAQMITDLKVRIAQAVEQEKHLNEKLDLFKKELEELHKLTQEQFRNLASTILDEKGQSFVKTNKTELSNILDPLKNDLSLFKKTIEDTRKEDIQDITSLKKEIENLKTLNSRLSDDAQQLVQALKGDSKIQGDWGEDRLKMIIENEGLIRYLDYDSQRSLYDDEERRKRTDIIINLPGGKHIIIDSKVSLNAYVDYFNATDPEEKKKHLKKHLESVICHMDSLSGKNYQSLTGLKSADYVFMFMPIEQSLTIALNEDPTIFNKALEKKVVLITPMTLVSTMKIVKILWQAESRVKNVETIFEQCGRLYDKFVGFLEDLQCIGKNLDAATRAHHDAMNKLKDGAKKGDTIIGRFESIRELEAKTKKVMPRQMLDEIGYLEETEG